MVPMLKKELNDELGYEAGSLGVRLLIDFIAKEFGATIYGRALTDRCALLSKPMAAMLESV